jgi:mannosyltransferase
VFLRNPVQQDLTDRWHWPIVALFVAVNAIVKSIDLGFSSYFLDEAVHLWFAQMSVPELVAQARNDPNPPLYNILIAGWIRLFGISEVATRAFSVMCVSLAAGALFHFLRRHFGLWVGLLSAAVWTCTAYPIHVAHLARPYGLMLLLNVTTYSMLLGALRWGQWWRHVLLALSTGAMIFAHPTSVFNLPALFLLILFMPAAVLANRAWTAVGVMAGGALFAVYYITAPYYANGSASWLQPPSCTDLLRVANQLLTLQYDQIGLLHKIGLVLIVVAGAVVSLRRAEGSWRPYLLGLLWTLSPYLVNAAFSHLSNPVFQENYVVSAHIGLAVLAGASLAALPYALTRVAVGACLCVLLASYINTEQTNNEDWRLTAAHASATASDSTCSVIFPWYQYRSFAFYYDREGYAEPKSTIAELAAKNAFIVLRDVIGLDERPRFSICHLIVAYNPDQKGEEALRLLSRYALSCDTLRAEAVTTYTYRLDRARPVTRLSFSGKMGNAEVDDRSVQRLGPENEFSANIEFSTDSIAPTDGRYYCDAVIKGMPDLKGVNLVMSYFKDDQHISSSYIEVQGADNAHTDWQWAQNSIEFDPVLHKGARLRIYVWNPGKTTVWIDEMGLPGSRFR